MKLDNKDPIKSGRIKLTFDPTKISVTDAVYSQVLLNNNPTVTINNGNGTMDIGFNWII